MYLSDVAKIAANHKKMEQAALATQAALQEAKEATAEQQELMQNQSQELAALKQQNAQMLEMMQQLLNKELQNTSAIETVSSSQKLESESYEASLKAYVKRLVEQGLVTQETSQEKLEEMVDKFRQELQQQQAAIAEKASVKPSEVV